MFIRSALHALCLCGGRVQDRLGPLRGSVTSCQQMAAPPRRQEVACDAAMRLGKHVFCDLAMNGIARMCV